MLRKNNNSLLWTITILLCLITFTTPPCFAFRFGDIVRFSHRLYSSNNKPTQWNENLAKYCPRFGSSRTLAFNIEMESTEKKISFAFEDEKFSTSWIPLSDGKGNYLREIEFTFLYSQSSIREVKWKNTFQYIDDKVPKQITISYDWVEVGDTDLTNGIGFLLVSGLILSSVLLVYSIAKTQSEYEGKSSTHPERKPPSFYTDTANYLSTQHSDSNYNTSNKSFNTLETPTDESEFENFVGGSPSSFPLYKSNDARQYKAD